MESERADKLKSYLETYKTAKNVLCVLERTRNAAIDGAFHDRIQAAKHIARLCSMAIDGIQT
jgi:hypothetical protein